MNNRTVAFSSVAILLVLGAFGSAILNTLSAQKMPPAEEKTSQITTTPITPLLPDGKTNFTPEVDLLSPLSDTRVVSPLTLSGQARGNWFFEASFPIELVDANGKTLAKGIAQAQSDWMTEDFVPFQAILTWSATSTTATSGVLILKKDNPSGLPEHDGSFEVPVMF